MASRDRSEIKTAPIAAFSSGSGLREGSIWSYLFTGSGTLSIFFLRDGMKNFENLFLSGAIG